MPSYAIIVREHFPAAEAGARVGTVIMATMVGMALGGWMSGKVSTSPARTTRRSSTGWAWNALNFAIAFWLWRRVQPPPAARLRAASNRPLRQSRPEPRRGPPAADPHHRRACRTVIESTGILTWRAARSARSSRGLRRRRERPARGTGGLRVHVGHAHQRRARGRIPHRRRRADRQVLGHARASCSNSGPRGQALHRAAGNADVPPCRMVANRAPRSARQSDQDVEGQPSDMPKYSAHEESRCRQPHRARQGRARRGTSRAHVNQQRASVCRPRASPAGASPAGVAQICAVIAEQTSRRRSLRTGPCGPFGHASLGRMIAQFGRRTVPASIAAEPVPPKLGGQTRSRLSIMSAPSQRGHTAGFEATSRRSTMPNDRRIEVRHGPAPPASRAADLAFSLDALAGGRQSASLQAQLVEIAAGGWGRCRRPS